MTERSVHYAHPAYLARHLMHLGATAAGANGTNGQFVAPMDMQLRRAVAVVVTAGTTATNTLTARIGTTSIGVITLANSAAGFVASSGDLNTTLTAGSQFNLLKGTDATGVARVTLEWNVPVGSNLLV